MMTYKWFVRKQVVSPFRKQDSYAFHSKKGSYPFHIPLFYSCIRFQISTTAEYGMSLCQASHFPGIVFPNQVYNPYTDDGYYGVACVA